MLINIVFDPIIAQLGSFQLSWHGVFTALAVAIGIWYGSRRIGRAGIPAELLGSIVLWAIVGGVIGARLFHVMDHLSYYWENPVQAFTFWEGGVAVYGAFFGGVVGAIIAARRVAVPVWPLLDAGAPAMLVGQAIGRLGCLSNGDAWGAPTAGDWGIVYWHPRDLLPADLLGVPTHPYPLYEIAAVMSLLMGVWLVRGRLGPPGRTFLVAMLGYAVLRFGLSFFRQETQILWGLQEAQVIAVATAIVALVALLLLRFTHGLPLPLRPPGAII